MGKRSESIDDHATFGVGCGYDTWVDAEHANAWLFCLVGSATSLLSDAYHTWTIPTSVKVLAKLDDGELTTRVCTDARSREGSSHAHKIDQSPFTAKCFDKVVGENVGALDIDFLEEARLISELETTMLRIREEAHIVCPPLTGLCVSNRTSSKGTCGIYNDIYLPKAGLRPVEKSLNLELRSDVDLLRKNLRVFGNRLDSLNRFLEKRHVTTD